MVTNESLRFVVAWSVVLERLREVPDARRRERHTAANTPENETLAPAANPPMSHSYCVAWILRQVPTVGVTERISVPVLASTKTFTADTGRLPANTVAGTVNSLPTITNCGPTSGRTPTSTRGVMLILAVPASFEATASLGVVTLAVSVYVPGTSPIAK